MRSSGYSYDQHFNVPNESDKGETPASADYWFRYGNTLFLVLNVNNTSTAEHKEFMEDAISKNTDAAWKVVAMHHSVYSVADHAFDKDILQRREALVPVFKDLDIDVVLQGHDHVYVRSYMMDGLTPVTDAAEYDTAEKNSVTDTDNIPFAAFDVTFFNMVICMIIPAMAVSGTNLSTGGPGLLFIYLVKILNDIPGGRFLGILFFVAVMFAGVSSIINLYETPIATVQEEFHPKRVPATAVILILGGAVAMVIQGIVSQWMDFVSIYLAPLGALFAGIVFFWIAKKDSVGIFYRLITLTGVSAYCSVSAKRFCSPSVMYTSPDAVTNTASKSLLLAQRSAAFSRPMTNREVERPSHTRPSWPTTVTDSRPLSAGWPVAGSMMCQ